MGKQAVRARSLEEYWYSDSASSHLWVWLALPLTALYAALTALRRFFYRVGLFKVNRFSVPVVVVGNITVGGTGKTPVVVALVERFRKAGFKPGVVSRGYGGEAERYPLFVTAETAVQASGDEPGLIARRVGCPVMVDPKRSRAVRRLADQYDVDVVISDDGLQHYAMYRDAEIVVIDGQRRFGNGWLLPSGPLRESQARIQAADMVVVNGGKDDESSMHLLQAEAINLLDGSQLPLTAFAGRKGHAMAGIGHPDRFFSQLSAAGLKFESHAFPDHHAYSADNLAFMDGEWVLMTEKDAVKCRDLADNNCWYVPVEASFNLQAQTSLEKLTIKLKTIRNQHGQ